MKAVWIDDQSCMVATENVQSADPGVGPDRYQRAFDALAASGRDVAFTSFTFDPDETGSVVLIPETITKIDRKPLAEPLKYEILSDGSEEWQQGFYAMTDAIASEQVEKVVLARHVEIETTNPIDTMQLVSALALANPGCYSYDIAGLVGSSPELLVRVEDGLLTSNVLAGTATNVKDLSSEKVGVEHALAVQSAIGALTPHLLNWSTEKSITRQGAMVHASTEITGELLPGATIVDVLADLHPTAAVGGTPTDVALDLIRDHESPRGRYAGPVGWFNAAGNGVITLALRCMLVDGNNATLFAGGGLVAGSDRDSELAETEMKLQPVLEILG